MSPSRVRFHPSRRSLTPKYDSGWLPIAPNQIMTLTHNVGGDIDNYFVDMMFKEDGTYGIHIRYYAGEGERGAYWYKLTSTSINVYRRPADDIVNQIRIRIWAIK